MSEEAPTQKRIDLSTYTEPTRRAVYDAVVAIFFSSTPEEITAAQADPENHTVIINYSPDEAGAQGLLRARPLDRDVDAAGGLRRHPGGVPAGAAPGRGGADRASRDLVP
jgi:hypothetical protein